MDEDEVIPLRRFNTPYEREVYRLHRQVMLRANLPDRSGSSHSAVVVLALKSRHERLTRLQTRLNPADKVRDMLREAGEAIALMSA